MQKPLFSFIFLSFISTYYKPLNLQICHKNSQKERKKGVDDVRLNATTDSFMPSKTPTQLQPAPA